MPRKKVTFIKTGKEIKEGKFKGFKKVKKSKTMSEKRAKKKQAKGQGFIEPRAYGSSPAEMSPYKMESAKQEKYNLLHDNPVAKHGSWMSKHSNSAMMMKGPMKMGHSPAEMGHDSPAKNIDPKKIKKQVARIATGAIMPGLTPEVAKAAFNAAKKVGKGVKKVAKRIKHDMTGGFEHARKRRQMRGGN